MRRPVSSETPKDLDRRDSGQAHLAAEFLDVAEDVIETHAPADRAERQVVAGETHRDAAEDQRRRQIDPQSGEQADPRGQAEFRREYRRRVCTDADQRGLPE
jgi:hypothetical protein